jgi:O-antigen ligase
MLLLIISLTLAGSALVTLVSGRVLRAESIATSVGEFERLSGWRAWTLRLANLLVLGTCATQIARWLLCQAKTTAGFTLWLSYTIFFLSNMILSAVLGTSHSFEHGFLYAPIVMLAVYLHPGAPPESYLRHLQASLGLFLMASLAAAVILPDLTLETGYYVGIVGLPVRLWGLANHANILGPLAAFYLVVVMHSRVCSSGRLAAGTLGLIVMVLAQSKTAWAGMLLAGAVLCARWFAICLRSAYAFGRQHPSSTVAIGSTAMLMVALAAVLVTALVVDFSALAARLTAGPEASSLATFTGRTMVWNRTLEEWQRSPLFGYGPSLWGPEYRLRMGMSFAGQAHNQFIQTLGQAGLVGVAGLLVYVGALVAAAVRTAAASAGLSVALLAIVLVRTFTESPFHHISMLNVGFYLHLVYFGYLMVLLKSQAGAGKEQT